MNSMRFFKLMIVLSLVAVNPIQGFAQTACPTVEEAFPIMSNMSTQQTQVDILMVIDNSNSMREYQDALARQIETLTEQLNRFSLDFNIGIVTTDSRVALTGHKNPKLNSELSQKNLHNFKKLFRLYSNVGINGSPLEAGLDAVKTFLTKEGHAFLRPGAQFVVFNLTDTDDPEHSKISPTQLRDLILQYKSQDKVHVFNFLGDHGEHYSELRSLFQGKDYFPMSKKDPASAKNTQADAKDFMKKDFSELADGMVRSIPKTYEFTLRQPIDRASRATLSATLRSRALGNSDNFRLDGNQKIVFMGSVEGNDELRIRYQRCPDVIKESNLKTPVRNVEATTAPSKPVDVSLEAVIGQVDNRMNRELSEISLFTQTREQEINSQLQQLGPLSPAELKKFIAKAYANEKKDERNLKSNLTQSTIDLLNGRAELDRIEKSIAILQAKKRIEPKPADAEVETKSLKDDISSLEQRLKLDPKPLLIILDTSGSMRILAGPIFNELEGLLSGLPAGKSFNIATINTSGKVDLLSPEPISRDSYSRQKFINFINEADYGGNSVVVLPLKQAIESRKYGSVIMVSDSELYDAVELVQVSKTSPIPIYGLITWEDSSTEIGQTLAQYQREYLQKLASQTFEFKRQLIAYRLALKKAVAGADLKLEVESLRKLLSDSNRSFEMIELEVFENCSHLTAIQIEGEVENLERSVATLENSMSALILQAREASRSIDQDGISCEGAAVPLATAACLSGGRAFMIKPSQPIFTTETMNRVLKQGFQITHPVVDSAEDEKELLRLEAAKKRAIDKLQNLMR